MSRYSSHRIDNSFPSQAPTYTANASIAFKLQDGTLPGDGTPPICRLSCADRDVLQCFQTRRFDDRDDYHDKIAQLDHEEFKFFGEPGRTREGDTMRVYTIYSRSPSPIYKRKIDPGESEGHRFRHKGTQATFEADLGGVKWTKDVPVEGWLWVHGEMKVSCAVTWMLSKQTLMGVNIDVNPGLGPQEARR